MNKKMKLLLGSGAVVLAVAGCAGLRSASFGSGLSQYDQFVQQSGGSSSIPCPGVYTGYAKMTNDVQGGYWFTSPTNASSCTFTDATGLSTQYVGVTCAENKLFGKWCGTNSVTFPVTPSTLYCFTLYVKSPLPPPTNNQTMNLQVSWQ